MDQIRVLILDDESLLGLGLGSILSQSNRCFVNNISSQSPPDLVQEIERFRPDIVVLSEDEDFFSDSSGLVLSLLKKFARIRLMVFDTNTNLVDIYDKNQKAINQASDLLDCLNLISV